MAERGVSVEHSSINRWAIRLLPLIEKMDRKRKRPVGASWRMDETYVKVKGVWEYLYRAVDKQGKTVDFPDRKARHGRGEALLRQGHANQWRSRESRDGQERRQQGRH